MHKEIALTTTSKQLAIIDTPLSHLNQQRPTPCLTYLWNPSCIRKTHFLIEDAWYCLKVQDNLKLLKSLPSHSMYEMHWVTSRCHFTLLESTWEFSSSVKWHQAVSSIFNQKWVFLMDSMSHSYGYWNNILIEWNSSVITMYFKIQIACYKTNDHPDRTSTAWSKASAADITSPSNQVSTTAKKNVIPMKYGRRYKCGHSKTMLIIFRIVNMGVKMKIQVVWLTFAKSIADFITLTQVLLGIQILGKG